MERSKEKMRALSISVLYVAGLIVAYGLKRHYSVSGSDDLLWILYPTAFLVDFLSGLDFIFVPDSGFVNYAHDITIAPACSGMNFMIICFCVVFFSFLHLRKSAGSAIAWLGISMAGAYFFTILVNTLRIVISIILITKEVHYGFFDQARMHLIAGVMINCFFLFLFHQFMGRVAGAFDCLHKNEVASSILLKTLVAASPLCWYFFITLAIPLITGNFRDNTDRFYEHCFIVVSTFAVFFVALNSISTYFGKRLFSSAPFLKTISETPKR